MRNFVVKTAFKAEDITASRMQMLIIEAIEDAFPDVEFRFAIVPDEVITDSDWERENAFEGDITRAMNAGFNPNPLPEGMPEL